MTSLSPAADQANAPLSPRVAGRSSGAALFSNGHGYTLVEETKAKVKQAAEEVTMPRSSTRPDSAQNGSLHTPADGQPPAGADCVGPGPTDVEGAEELVIRSVDPGAFKVMLT